MRGLLWPRKDMGLASAYRTAVLRDGPVGYWRLGDVGTVAGDATALQNGTALYGATLGSMTDPGQDRPDAARGAFFDGSDDMVQIPSRADLKWTGGDLTLEVWVARHASETTGGNLFSKPWNGSGEYNYRLFVNSPNNQVQLNLLGATFFAIVTPSTSPLAAGRWTHIVATINAATKNVAIYVDAVLLVSGVHNVVSWVPPAGDQNLALTLGFLFPYGSSTPNATFAFHGHLRDAAVYTKVLTPAQVLNHYRLGAGWAAVASPQSWITGALRPARDPITGSRWDPVTGTRWDPITGTRWAPITKGGA